VRDQVAIGTNQLILIATAIAVLSALMLAGSASGQAIVTTSRASTASSEQGSLQPTRAEGAAAFSMRATRLFEARHRGLTLCLNSTPPHSEATCILEALAAGRTATMAYDGLFARMGSPPYDIENAALEIYKDAELIERSKCGVETPLCRAKSSWAAEKLADEVRARLLREGEGPVAWAHPRSPPSAMDVEEEDDGDWGISAFRSQQSESFTPPASETIQPKPPTTTDGCRTIETSSETRDPVTGAISTTRGRSIQCGSGGDAASRRVQEMLDGMRR
jgi:hypothetical protein